VPAASVFGKNFFAASLAVILRAILSRRIQNLFIFLAAALLLGQRAAADAPFTVDAWSTADGLPQSSVIALAQTRDGWLWLGTLNGLARFDGDTFTPFNVNNTPALTSDKVVFLFEDSQKNLWLGTDDGGLCAMQNGAVKNFDTRAVGGKIIFASQDEAGKIWFCTASGRFFSVVNGQLDFSSAQIPEQLYYRVFHLRVPGKNGVIWSLQGGRIQKFRGEVLEKDFGATPWQNAQVAAVLNVTGGALKIPFDANVTAVAEDRDGNLVVGTHDSGVFWFDAAGNARHILTGRGQSQNGVLSLVCDGEGNLWVGTDGDGLERISKKTFSTPDAFTNGVAQSIAADGQGAVWAAFNRRGVTRVQTNSATDFSVGNLNNAWSVLVDANQNIWAGTRDEGVFKFDGANFMPVAAARKIGPQIFSQFQSRDGRVWFGGQDGLASFDGTDWKTFSTADGLPANPIRALAEDANTNLFIGTDGGGIFQLRAGKILAVNAPVKDISCLLADRDGILWAGTSGHGLARFAAGQWTTFSAADGLAADDIGYLIDDDFGNLWLGTYEGLVRVDKKSLADFAAGALKKISERTFLTRECSAGAQPAALKKPDGTILFPTIEGVVSVNPADLPRNTNAPPVVIESVSVDGASVAGDAVTLAPENEQLEIHFTALNFSAPKGAQFGARFKYQLQGRDKKFTDIGGERVAHFSKLASGHYVFRVTACNEDGVWNETGATLNVTVQPPFWKTPGFMVASILIFLGALAGIIYLVSTAKLKRQLRAAKQKEIVEHERARIARDLHDQLGANLTQITLLGEMAELDKTEPAEVEQHAQQICETARETTRALDEIVWAVNPSNDTLEGLVNYACKYAQDYFALAGVSYRTELPANLPAQNILPEVRHNVFLAFKEAVNNVVKHAGASEARVKLQLDGDKFILSVSDNGRGLGDISSKSLRNGMKNMKKRLADVRGEFEIAPAETGGTVARFTVPLKK
jgi:ligand-binding sensor domain-containing protein/signal transduction histidine kinase